MESLAEMTSEIVKYKTTFFYANRRIYKYTQLVEKFVGDIVIDRTNQANGSRTNNGNNADNSNIRINNENNRENIIIDLTDDGIIDLTNEGTVSEIETSETSGKAK